LGFNLALRLRKPDREDADYQMEQFYVTPISHMAIDV
jgi:hypothetical protein